MICVFIYTYHMISFFYIYFLQTCIIYIYIYKVEFLFKRTVVVFSREFHSKERRKARESDPWQHQCCMCCPQKPWGNLKRKGLSSHNQENIQGVFCQVYVPPQNKQEQLKEHVSREKKSLLQTILFVDVMFTFQSCCQFLFKNSSSFL